MGMIVALEISYFEYKLGVVAYIQREDTHVHIYRCPVFNNFKSMFVKYQYNELYYYICGHLSLVVVERLIKYK